MTKMRKQAYRSYYTIFYIYSFLVSPYIALFTEWKIERSSTLYKGKKFKIFADGKIEYFLSFFKILKSWPKTLFFRLKVIDFM